MMLLTTEPASSSASAFSSAFSTCTTGISLMAAPLVVSLTATSRRMDASLALAIREARCCTRRDEAASTRALACTPRSAVARSAAARDAVNRSARATPCGCLYRRARRRLSAAARRPTLVSSRARCVWRAATRLAATLRTCLFIIFAFATRSVRALAALAADAAARASILALHTRIRRARAAAAASTRLARAACFESLASRILATRAVASSWRAAAEAASATGLALRRARRAGAGFASDFSRAMSKANEPCMRPAREHRCRAALTSAACCRRSPLAASSLELV
mmetsp:Transcript_12018/g.27458  ORF Transcript_12018/g.27458 Transcript_12018/m.27458 type:complete len:283 (-) Transcript_12018:617-1465(-)